MGRTITPKYKVEVIHLGAVQSMARQSTDSAWHGRANIRNLERWVADYHKSLEPGGVNEHLTKAFGPGSADILRARILNNLTNEVVVQVWPDLNALQASREAK